jgi:hypothetical protein
MDSLYILARQPLFRLIAAVIVLLVTAYEPMYGAASAFAWVLWVYMGERTRGRQAIPASSIF